MGILIADGDSFSLANLISQLSTANQSQWHFREIFMSSNIQDTFVDEKKKNSY